MQIKSSINNKKVFININKAPERAKIGVRNAFYKIGKVLVKTSDSGIKKPPKTGRIYRYGRRRHQASAPGEYPANRSGVLRRSLGFKVTSFRFMEFGAKAPYAGYLENGTSRMESRTFLEKSVKGNSDTALRIFRDELNDELG